jgi:lipid A 3-O-deacylase
MTSVGTHATLATALALGVSLAGASVASAQVPALDEVRFGLMVHSIEPSNAEGGADINFELLLRRFSFTHTNTLLDLMLRPRIHLGVSANTAGDTSQIYTGLTWDAKLAPKVSLELSFGASWHNGPTALGLADSYGCSANFRESLSLGYALDERWTLYGTIAHMSNAQLCDQNTGITSVGVRLGYKLE